jgi:hypothetical protein
MSRIAFAYLDKAADVCATSALARKAFRRNPSSLGGQRDFDGLSGHG